MGSRLTGIVVDSIDPQRLAGFWAAVLDRSAAGDGEFAWIEMHDDEVAIGFQRVSQPTPGKNRIHLDLTPSGATQEEESGRLRSLAAEEADVGQPKDASWIVLKDPEGNIFCLLRPG